MRIYLPGCFIRDVENRIARLRDEGGIVAMGRVLTLIVVASEAQREQAVHDANMVSREHPMRIVVFTPLLQGEETQKREELKAKAKQAEAKQAERLAAAAKQIRGREFEGPQRKVLELHGCLDAEIRLGSDAGASEVILLTGSGAAVKNLQTLLSGLILPDIPLVTWWVGETPAAPGATDLGGISLLRITSISEHPPAFLGAKPADPQLLVKYLASGYRSGDTDLAWARLSLWRTQLANILDYQPELELLSARVAGDPRSLPCLLLVNWLRMSLPVPVEFSSQKTLCGDIHEVSFSRGDGVTTLRRISSEQAILSKPGFPDSVVALPLTDQLYSLAEELRMLEPDRLYAELLSFSAESTAENPSGKHMMSALKRKNTVRKTPAIKKRRTI